MPTTKSGFEAKLAKHKKTTNTAAKDGQLKGYNEIWIDGDTNTAIRTIERMEDTGYWAFHKRVYRSLCALQDSGFRCLFLLPDGRSWEFNRNHLNDFHLETNGMYKFHDTCAT